MGPGNPGSMKETALVMMMESGTQRSKVRRLPTEENKDCKWAHGKYKDKRTGVIN